VVSRVVVLVVLAGCSFPSVDLSTKGCPCAEGWWCDTRTDTCMEGDAPDAGGRDDAGVDAGADQGPPAVDAAVDAGVEDLGADAGPEDMFVPVDAPATTTTVIPFGSDWEYHDQSDAPPTDWREGVGDWPSGPAELGYGDGDEATMLLDADPNVPSTYFRTTIQLTSEPTAVLMEVLYDDAVTVWVNDTLVAQENWTADMSHGSYVMMSTPDNSTVTVAVPPSSFLIGTNRISAMVKQHSTTSTDLSFDLRLEVTAP
jgi:hypothetical protein